MSRFYALALALLVPAAAVAQSGSGAQPRPTYSQPASGSQPTYGAQPGSGSQPAGSGAQPAAGSGAAGSGTAAGGAPVALDGYCAVCLAVGKGWVTGAPQLQMVYDGKTYRFPKQEVMATFQADPAKYVPALGGDDVVEYARSGNRVAGKTLYGAKYLDRFYFFASEANKQAFSANPTQYANADVAAGGDCVVCRVNMQKQMPGSPQFTTVHNGLRYQFAGAQQQQAFLAQPQRYESAAGSGSRPAGSGSAPRPAAGSGSAPRPAAGSGSGGR